MSQTALDCFQFIQQLYFDNEPFLTLEKISLKFFSEYSSIERESVKGQSIEDRFLECLDFLTFLRSLNIQAFSSEQSQRLEKQLLYSAGATSLQVPFSCDVARNLLREFEGFWEKSQQQQKELLVRVLNGLHQTLENIEQDCSRLRHVMYQRGYHNLFYEVMKFRDQDKGGV